MNLTKYNPFATTRYDPFSEVDDFIDRYLRTFNRPLLRGFGNGSDYDWAPATDVSENEKEYMIQIETPGIKKDDIHVSVEDEILTIKGEREEKKEEKNVKYYRTERSYGKFIRSFSLPRDVDGSKVKAEYVDGVLNLHLPKSKEAKPKSLEVKVN